MLIQAPALQVPDRQPRELQRNQYQNRGHHEQRLVVYANLLSASLKDGEQAARTSLSKPSPSCQNPLCSNQITPVRHDQLRVRKSQTTQSPQSIYLIWLLRHFLDLLVDLPFWQVKTATMVTMVTTVRMARMVRIDRMGRTECNKSRACHLRRPPL